MSCEESLRRSLAAQEVASYNTTHYWKSGEDNAVFDTKHIFNKDSLERRRIKNGDILPEGFIYSIGMSESHKQNRREFLQSTKGQKKPWVSNITNKNPDKIRKTSEKHRGMKRTQETCNRIRDAANIRVANGEKQYLFGKVKLFNKITRKLEYMTPKIKLELLNDPNYTDEQLCSIIDSDNNKCWHPKSESIPVGYVVYRRKSPIK